MAGNWYAGNANTDSKDRRSWLIGHSIARPAISPCSRAEVGPSHRL